MNVNVPLQFQAEKAVSGTDLFEADYKNILSIINQPYYPVKIRVRRSIKTP